MDLGKYYASPIWLSVKKIFENQDVSFKTKMSVILHTVDQDYPVFKVLSLDYVRDYATSMMDISQIKVMIPLGDYINLVYPNKDNLEITVSVKHLQSIGDNEDSDKEIEEIRYKAIFDPSNPRFGGSDIANTNQNTLNMTSIETIKLRLMDRNAEPLRVKTTQGAFRGVTPENLIKSILLGESQNVLIDGAPAVSGLDLIPPDQTDPILQIVIPSGTFISELPTYIQEYSTGVYKYSMGTYFQRFNGEPMWFVYPLYDHDRFDKGKEQKVAIFYSVPPKIGTGVEHTYKVDGNVVEIAITTDKSQMDTTDVTQLNYGVGYRLADQNAFLKKPVVIDSSNKAVGARGNLNQEVSFTDRGDGLNFVPTIRKNRTNPFHETSQVSARQTALLKFIWENADPSLIYPGMPCKYCFMQDDEVVEIKGTILGIHSSRNRQGTLGESDRYSSRCVLSIATALNQQFPEYLKEQSYAP